MEKNKINLLLAKERHDELKELSNRLEMSVAVLVRLGIALIIKKYKNEQ